MRGSWLWVVALGVCVSCTKEAPIPSVNANANANVNESANANADGGANANANANADGSANANANANGNANANAGPSLVSAPTSTAVAVRLAPIGGARPLRTLHVPSDPKPGEKFPLILELHGYGADGPSQDKVMGIQSLVESQRVIIAAPDGLRDSSTDHFWNATDTCCNFENNPVDDVAYLRSLVEEIDQAYGVDRTHVFAVGHSNGGAMAQRLACDAADVFAAVISIAGPGFEDTSRCKPSRPISIRHMHGTRDGLIPYVGGPIPPLAGHHPKGMIPSAKALVENFAKLDGCDATGQSIEPSLDLDAAVPGEESHVTRWEHCKDGVSVELVTMDHVGHALWKPTDAFTKVTWDFLSAHARSR